MSKKKTTTKKNGRPTKYTKTLADKICAELSEGKSMRTVCLSDKMPDKSTIFRWLRENEGFRDQYETAKQESTDAMAEEIQDISDDGTNDWIEKEIRDKKGRLIDKVEVLNHEHVQRSRLRIDTRKWLMAKMKPKKYGEKLDLTSDGEKLATVPITGMKIVIEK